jgi:3-oxoacyl-[acyl-carrier protein] reductase
MGDDAGMDLGLKNKRALVTAASGGLGYAIAHALAGEGARIAICSRDQARAAAAADRIRADTGAEVHAFAADVADAASLTQLFDATQAALGGLDVLVNNAGGPPPGTFLDLDETKWARGYDLTLMSVVRSIRLALPAFERAGGGRVLTVMSSSVKQALPNLFLSNVYRPALAGLTKALAVELGPKNVQIVGIAPGRIATERTDELDRGAAARAGKTYEEVRAASVATMPAGRLGDPEEFGRVGAFLCSKAASYVSGSVVLVDGGSVRAL